MLKRRPLALTMKISIGGKVRAAAIINVVAYALFAGHIGYEHSNLKDYWKAMNTNLSGATRPYLPTAVIEGGIPFLVIFVMLILPNSVILVPYCFKKRWAVCLWIETNALGTMCMIIWIVMVFSDEEMAGMRRRLATIPTNFTPGHRASLRFIAVGLFLVFGGIGFLSTILMFQYAKFLQAQAGEMPAPAPPPPAAPSANQVQPIVSHHETVHPAFTTSERYRTQVQTSETKTSQKPSSASVKK